MPNVSPRWKSERVPKKPRRLRRVGRKMTADRDEMRAARRALLERSQGRCEAGFVLGCTGIGVHAHHIKRRSQGGTNALVNLVWCCAPCHQGIHHHPELARELGFLAPKGTA